MARANIWSAGWPKTVQKTAFKKPAKSLIFSRGINPVGIHCHACAPKTRQEGGKALKKGMPCARETLFQKQS